MWEYNYTRQDELCHYGILGMKWGRRRFQKKDGSLTPTGKKRYDDDSDGASKKTKKTKENSETSEKKNIFSRHKDKLIQKYKDKGYDAKAAETAARNQMKTEVILGSIAAVTVAVVGVKVARRIGQEYCDKTFKSGKVIQNIGPNGETTFKDNPFFAAVNKHDKKAYASMYPNEKRMLVKAAEEKGGQKYGGIFKNSVQITNNAKRASVSNARKIFYQKMDTDPEFRKQVLDSIKKTQYTKGVDSYLSGKKTKRLYDSFNQALATPAFQEAGVHTSFYSELKKKGYDAVLDINDSRYSGYKKISKDPTIFFNGEKMKKLSAQKFDETEIDKNAVNYASKFLLTSGLKLAGTLTVAKVGVDSISDKRKVNEYLDEHPNSKLSSKQILEIV